MTLQAENDELRLQELTDRQRISQLLNHEASGGSEGRRPNYNIDHIMLKMESLQAQLNEQARKEGGIHTRCLLPSLFWQSTRCCFSCFFANLLIFITGNAKLQI